MRSICQTVALPGKPNSCISTDLLWDGSNTGRRVRRQDKPSLDLSLGEPELLGSPLLGASNGHLGVDPRRGEGQVAACRSPRPILHPWKRRVSHSWIAKFATRPPFPSEASKSNFATLTPLGIWKVLHPITDVPGDSDHWPSLKSVHSVIESRSVV